MKHSRLIALLTDFGTGSPYIASMKGQILSINPNAAIVDISHTVTPFNINEAAYILWSVYKSFPEGTIFVTVVDPGVGSKRKIILAEALRYLFLAPDNGVLHFVLDSLNIEKVREVNNESLFSKNVSPTFHGRDIFAPVAAHLALGLPANKVGPILKLERERKSSIVVLKKTPGIYQGEIIFIDSFGNIITNVILKKIPSSMRIKIRDKIIQSHYETYALAPEGIPFFLIGSSQLLEISIKNASAAKELNAKIGQKLKIIIS